MDILLKNVSNNDIDIDTLKNCKTLENTSYKPLDNKRAFASYQLKQLVKNQGITIDMFADKVGYSYHTMRGYIYKGIPKTRFDVITNEIIKAYNLPANYFGYMVQENKDDLILYDLLSVLDKEYHIGFIVHPLDDLYCEPIVVHLENIKNIDFENGMCGINGCGLKFVANLSYMVLVLPREKKEPQIYSYHITELFYVLQTMRIDIQKDLFCNSRSFMNKAYNDTDAINNKIGAYLENNVYKQSEKYQQFTQEKYIDTLTGGERMIDTNKLKGAIVSKGKTQEDVANYIGITPRTFYSKMKKGVFMSDEIEKMIEYLEIEEPMPIFFAN